MGHEESESGWTFIEAIIVIAIVIIMSGTVAFSAVRYVERARRASTESRIAATRIALHAYYLDTGTYPTQAQGLDALWTRPVLAPVPSGWRGPYVEAPVTEDAWGNELEYRLGNRGRTSFELVSLGADGLPGGSGDNADIGTTQ